MLTVVLFVLSQGVQDVPGEGVCEPGPFKGQSFTGHMTRPEPMECEDVNLGQSGVRVIIPGTGGFSWGQDVVGSRPVWLCC